MSNRQSADIYMEIGFFPSSLSAGERRESEEKIEGCQQTMWMNHKKNTTV